MVEGLHQESILRLLLLESSPPLIPVSRVGCILACNKII